MVKISLVSATLALATLSQASFLSKSLFTLKQSQPVNYFDTAHLTFYSACITGYMNGYIEGFYNN